MSIAAGIIRTVVEAVVEAVATVSGSRVLLSVGTHFDPTLIGPIPDNVHIEAWVDQASILAGADLVVCHGGSGTVLGALGAGVPMVAVPVFADQFGNARLVAGGGSREGHPPWTGRHRTIRGRHRRRPGDLHHRGRGNGPPRSRLPRWATRIAAEMADMSPADEVLAELLPRYRA